MAAARRLPAAPPQQAAEPECGPRWEVPAAEGKMAAAVVLAAGLCVARRAVAVAGPRGVQVRGGLGARKGSCELCLPPGPGTAFLLGSPRLAQP